MTTDALKGRVATLVAMRAITTLLFVLTMGRLQAGGDPISVGARQAGMGYAGLTLTDLWSLRMNPAGIAGLKVATAGAFYQQHYLSSDLSHQGLAVVLPVKKGAFGISADRYGYSLYNESRVALAYAMQLNEGLRVAVQMNYLGVRLGDNYGSTSAVTAEIGVQARLTESLWLGAHLYNPNRASLGTGGDGAVVVNERVPTLLRAGLGYTFSSKLLMTLDAEKDIDRQERFRIGVEYTPSKVLVLRTGLSTGPVQGHFGVGFRLNQLDIDLALSVRSQLGPTPMLGLNYRFK
jgi:hypothetical protein